MLFRIIGAVLLVLGIVWVIALATQGKTIVIDDSQVDQGSITGGLQNFGSGATQSTPSTPTVTENPTAEPSPTENTPTRQSRRPSNTSTENKIRFEPGEEVVGFRIEYDFDGTAITVGRECYDPNPRVAGWVLDGVVWPDPGEFEGKPQCEPVAWGGPESENSSSDEGSGFNPLRRETGEGGSGTFSAGEPIVAGYVEYWDGQVADGPCYDQNPYTGGTIYGGVVYPEPGETNIPVCSPYWKQAEQPEPEPTHDPRLSTADNGGPIDFGPGTPVAGYFTIDGVKYDGCYVASSWGHGTVTDGVIYPWPGELPAECTNSVAEQPAPTPEPEPEPEPVDPRKSTADYGPINFGPGTPVVGYFTIDGVQYNGCYMASAWGNGTVTDGAIYPWPDETTVKTCDEPQAEQPPVEEQPPSGSRLSTADNGGPINFGSGTPVVGYFSIEGVQYNGCYMTSAWGNGTVTDGVIYPWDTEIIQPCQ